MDLYQTPAKMVYLPEDPAAKEFAQASPETVVDIAAQNLQSPLSWAILAEGALSVGTKDADISAYAFAQQGKEIGMNLALAEGWVDGAFLPWSHVPNQAFLRCSWAFAVANHRLGELETRDSWVNIIKFSSAEGYQILAQRMPLR